jgi:hypothetical protein
MNTGGYRRKEAAEKSRPADTPLSRGKLKNSSQSSPRDNHPTAATANRHLDCRAIRQLLKVFNTRQNVEVCG